jgi:hypothetical protein
MPVNGRESNEKQAAGRVQVTGESQIATSSTIGHVLRVVDHRRLLASTEIHY